MMHRFCFFALAAGVALAGCSGGTGSDNTTVDAGRAVIGSLSSAVKVSRDGPRLEIDVTRAQLDSTPGAVLQAVPDITGAQDFLRLIARRDDSNPGTVEVWESSDNAQIILRDGVLVGTKGLGGDMRSAQAATTIAGFDGQGGGGQRRITLARLNGTAQTVSFACDMTQLGRETIRIVDQQVSTYRMREECSQGAARFTNEYWVETGSGKMRKSRQWAGPTFGYINLLRLKG